MHPLSAVQGAASERLPMEPSTRECLPNNNGMEPSIREWCQGVLWFAAQVRTGMEVAVGRALAVMSAGRRLPRPVLACMVRFVGDCKREQRRAGLESDAR